MSGLIVGLVLRLKISDQYNSEAKFIAAVYADHAWEDGTHAHPAVETVAKITGFSERTVQRYLRVLEGMGVMARTGKGPRGTNSYSFPLTENEDGSVRLNIARVDSAGGDTQSPRQADGGDTESGDTESGDTESGDTAVTPEQTNNPSVNPVVVVNAIVKLVENEICAMTPLILEAINAACVAYPPDWIPEAIDIAVKRGARRWDYVEGILRNCKQAGKRPSLNRLENKHGNTGSNSGKSAAGKAGTGSRRKAEHKTGGAAYSAEDLAAADAINRRGKGVMPNVSG